MMRFLSAACLALSATHLHGETIVGAEFGAPTSRYQHAVLGDAIEWGELRIIIRASGSQSIAKNAVIRKDDFVNAFRLPLDHVFEDVSPRLWDVTGDGSPEVVVVETDVNKGAALAIYGRYGKIAETPHIGRTNRWLAPIGAADLDGDGHIEVAYVDRPHLAKTIRVWRFRDGALEPVADLPGFTNHRIGEPDIAGGMRRCGGVDEMIVATADWSRVVAVRFDGAQFQVRDLGPHEGRASFARARAC